MSGRAQRAATAPAVKKKRRAPVVREGVFQRRMEIALNAPTRHTRVQRINSGQVHVQDASGSVRVIRGAHAGTGDLPGYTIPDGLHLEVETKAHGEKLSPAQVRRQAEAQRAGWIYVVVYGPRTLAELDEAVQRGVAQVDEAIARRRARA